MSLSTSVCKMPLLAVTTSWLLPLSFSLPCYCISTQGHKEFYSRVYVWMCTDVLLSHTCRGQKCWHTHTERIWPHFNHTIYTYWYSQRARCRPWLKYQSLLLLLHYLHGYPFTHDAVSIKIPKRISPWEIMKYLLYYLVLLLFNFFCEHPKHLCYCLL